ncbi:MAG: hypothetical protein LW835_06505 [Burkholderiaceae bacterium]|jgi:hypothetical protein|nr:hypothetical protein [Burkholderiaceae bacterium]
MQAMDERLVYSKTPKGTAEMAARSAALSMGARRVLILVDGKRTVADLAPLLKPGEIDGVLAQLEAQGFISRNQSFEPTRPATRALDLSVSLDVSTVGGLVEERNLLTLDEAKRRAVRELIELLGPDGETMSLRIEQCRNGDELRDRVREAERLVAGVLGEASAQDYMRALRRGR